MSLFNVKCGIGDHEFSVYEPATRQKGARFIAERARAGGNHGFRKMREIMRRAVDGDPTTVRGVTYWIERF